MANRRSTRLPALQRKLAARARKFTGIAGLHAVRLDNGAEVALNADRDFPTASIAKIPILLEVLRQVGAKKLTYARRYAYHTKALPAKGSGVLRYLDGGLRLTLKDWCTLMMNVSDNRATNFLIDLVGAAAVNRFLKDHEIGPLVLHGKLFRKNPKPKGTRHFAQGTPRAWTTLMAKLVRGELLPPWGTAEALRIMRIQGYITNIRRNLPVNAWAEPDPKKDRRVLWVASKPGGFSGFRGEVGVIHLPGDKYIAFAAMGERSKDKGWSPTHEGHALIGDLAKLVWEGMK